MRFTVRLTGVLVIWEKKKLLLDKTVEYLNLHGKYYGTVLLPASVHPVVNGQVINHVADVLIPYYLYFFLGHSFFIHFIFLHTPKLQELFRKHQACNCVTFSKIHHSLWTKKIEVETKSNAFSIKINNTVIPYHSVQDNWSF